MKRISSHILSWLLGILLITGLIAFFSWVGSVNPLLSTSIADLFDITLSFAIFAMAWSTNRFAPNGQLLVLGAGFLTITLFDGAHLLLMIQNPSPPNQALPQADRLWELSYLMQGFTIFIAPFFLNRPIKPYLTLSFFLLAAGGLMIPVLRPDLVPTGLGQANPGTTERLLDFPAIFLLILGGAHLLYRWKDLDKDFARFVLLSIGLAVIAEIIDIGIHARSLPAPTAVYVHSLQTISFLLVFIAGFDVGYRKPFEYLFQDLTDQKEVLQDIFDVNPGGLAILSSQDRTFRMVNQAYRSLTPHPERNPIGLRFEEVWSGTSSYRQQADLFERSIKTRQAVFIERFSLASQENIPKFANLFFKPTAWRGSPAVLATIWEVTGLEIAQQKAEAAAQEANQWAAELQVLMDAVPVAVLISLDEEGKQIVGNEAAYRLFHLPPGSNLSVYSDDKEQRPYLPFANGRILQNEELAIQEVLQTGIPKVGIEQEVELKDGTHLVLYGNIHPLYDDANRPRSVIGAFMDITHMVEIEKALRESENRFRSLVDSINDLVVTFDRDLQPTSVFGKSIQQFGMVDSSDFQRLVKLIVDPDTTRHEDALKRAIQGDNVVYEWDLQWGDQSLSIQTSLSPMRDVDGEIIGVVGIGREITRLKQVERELEQYAAQLERSNKELEQFAFVASHDLQEPLRKIRFFSDRLTGPKGMVDEVEKVDFVERIQSATRRMQTMIDDLLAYSRVTTKRQPFSRVELKPLVEDVLADLESRIAQTRGHVEVGDLPAIEADPLQMRQLFQNLIGNALKYHQSNVPPEVKICCQPCSTPGYIEVVVEDNGIGFDEKYVGRIFQPFERLHGRSEYEGTGMGLAICRKIVEQHGGEITAHSEIGKGSTFLVRLPKKKKARVENPAS